MGLIGRFGEPMSWNALLLRVRAIRRTNPSAKAVKVVLKEKGKRVEKLAYFHKGKYYIP